MNKLSVKDRIQILNCLSEGMGVNATARITGKSNNTVLKLLAEVGEACALYQDRVMNNLPCKEIQVDEIWSFVGAKQKNVTEDHPEGYGDCYTFTSIDPVSKLMPCWLVGTRTREATIEFISDLAPRFTNRIQLTSDGFRAYMEAVDKAFNGQVDFAMLNKSYATSGPTNQAHRRYSPPEFVTCSKEVVHGKPDLTKVSTSLVERSNLSIRMSNRRFTRLTNSFSRKFENHAHAMALFMMVYNFVKIHRAIKTTPAMEAGVADFLWSMEDIVLMTETNA